MAVAYRLTIKDTQCGFTLLELMLVAVIILALVTVSTPLFKKTYDDLRLASSAKEVASLMRFCRERAVFERRVFRVNIDSNNKTYQALAENEDEDEQKLTPLKSRWGRRFRLPDAIDVETEREEIDFFPDGTATYASIYLTDKEGKTFSVLIEPDTGLVKEYDYKKE